MIISAGIKSLAELHKILDCLPHGMYAQRSQVLGGSSIGDHMRHIIEFYECLLFTSDSVINYDLRKRDQEISTNTTIARHKIDLCLIQLHQSDTHGQLEIYCSSGECMVKSSFARELMYCMEHSTHHLAMIRIALHEAGVSGLTNLGFSPATLKFHQTVKTTVNEINTA